MPRIQQIIETLEAERAEVQQKLDWLDEQLEEFRAHDAARENGAGGAAVVPPPRSGRRATAKRASARRAAARSVKRDVAEEIVHFLKKHPGSTAGEVAKGVNITRNSAAAKLVTMTKAGDLVKAERGYSVKP